MVADLLNYIDHLGIQTRYWLLMRPANSRRATPGSAMPIHQHRGQDPKRPSGSLLGVCGPAGHTLIDRRLYLPKAWGEDQARLRPPVFPTRWPAQPNPPGRSDDYSRR